jgi:isocitrate/isopropylmalate dehydrogenase
MLRSTALLLEHGLGRPRQAADLVHAVERGLELAPTPDVGGSATTAELSAAIRAQLPVDGLPPGA